MSAPTEYLADSLLMESGRFWCVYEGTDGRAGRLVRAYHGEGAREKAQAHVNRLNKEAA